MLGLEQRFSARGLRVVSVTRTGEDDEERKSVADAAKELHMEYPCFIDPNEEWTAKAGIKGIPLFLVIGKNGKLVYRHAGKLEQGTAQFDAMAAAVERAVSS